MPDVSTSMFTVLAHIPGVRTLTEDRLAELWFRLSDEGLVEALFHDGGVRNVGEFMAFMESEKVYCYAVYREGAPIAFTWLNNFAGRAAMIHFAVLAAGRGVKTEVGRFVVRFLLHGKDSGGNYCLEALYGLTPEPYAHVLRYIRRLGFRKMGSIPGSVVMRKTEDDSPVYVGGIVSVCTRESMELP
ncbi:MAG: hypothetical protein ACK5JO_01830 [Halodesulfovibrio sp.]